MHSHPYAFDYEKKQAYTFPVCVSDSNHTIAANVTINIMPVNEFVPTVNTSKNCPLKIMENSEITCQFQASIISVYIIKMYYTKTSHHPLFNIKLVICTSIFLQTRIF